MHSMSNIICNRECKIPHFYIQNHDICPAGVWDMSEDSKGTSSIIGKSKQKRSKFRKNKNTIKNGHDLTTLQPKNEH